MTVINTNVKSLVAAEAINGNNNRLSTAMQRLSTGLRVNSAKDDAAGLSIGTRMEAQTRGLNMAIKNANDGISLLQTAEGAMQEVTNALQRMRELAVQAASETNQASDRSAMNDEFKQLQSEIDRISAKTQFNGMNILDGSFRNKSLQIGDKAGNALQVSVASVSTASLGSGSMNSQGTVVGTRVSATAADLTTTNTIKINGVKLKEVQDEINDPVNASGTGYDIADVVDTVNASNAGVTASAYNEVVANKVGTGISEAGGVVITVVANGSGQATSISLGATSSLTDLKNAINMQGGASTVQATINDEGKLVLSNDSGATIYVRDTTAGAVDDSYDTATGLASMDDTGDAYDLGDSATWGSTAYTGFLKLTSNTAEPITVEVDDPANVGDVNNLGLNLVSAEGAVTGAEIDSTTVTDPSYITSGTLVINGVDIWDANNPTEISGGGDDYAAANAMVALINKFSDQTGVTAGVYNTDATHYALTLKSINNAPIQIDLGDEDPASDKGKMAQLFGFKAQNMGASDFNSNTGRVTDFTGGGTVASATLVNVNTATNAISVLDGALNSVSMARSKLGAYINRLDSTVSNLSNVVTNTQASRSRIMDADYATETTNLARAQIIQQAATAMLAQANQSAQTVLTLLK